MAIFHCAVSHGSRKDGQSGAAKVDYIMRTGKYSRDPGELIGACAGHLPSWAGGNPRVFFAAADEYERSNGRLVHAGDLRDSERVERRGLAPVGVPLRRSGDVERGAVCVGGSPGRGRGSGGRECGSCAGRGR